MRNIYFLHKSHFVLLDNQAYMYLYTMKFLQIISKAIYYRIKLGKGWMEKLESSTNHEYFYTTYQVAKIEADKKHKFKGGIWHVIRFADAQYAVVHQNYIDKNPERATIYATR